MTGRKLVAFMNVTLNGFFADANGDMSWAHRAADDEEWNAFTAANASGGGALLFGRKTYEMMARFWPTPAAMQAMPTVAAGMNAMPKFVVSRSLAQAGWNNTTLLKGELGGEIRKLKAGPGEDIAVLGSGSIVTQLSDLGLIDEYQIVVTPVVLGKGRTLFDGVKDMLSLTLVKSQTFKNGNVVLWYRR